MFKENKTVKKTARKHTGDKDRTEVDKETVTMSSIIRLIVNLQTEFFLSQRHCEQQTG